MVYKVTIHLFPVRVKIFNKSFAGLQIIGAEQNLTATVEPFLPTPPANITPRFWKRKIICPIAVIPANISFNSILNPGS